ncbi:HNH endonuclease signature motif containing protein [Sorangium sp. So ce134]
MSDEHKTARFGLGTIDPEGDYYAITLKANENGEPTHTVFSHWVGWADGEPRRELREPSLVKAERMAQTWERLRMSYVVVNTEDQFLAYQSLIGGHALVRRELVEQLWPDLLMPNECIRRAPLGEFVNVGAIPKQSFRRVPTPKLRMSVFKRDQYRCKVCGRRPDDHLDLELHVHHIRQWSNGGLTEAWNLITLCSTCHKGLDPHEEPGLWNFIGQPIVPGVDEFRNEYYEGVRRFQVRRLQEARSDAGKARPSRRRRTKK